MRRIVGRRCQLAIDAIVRHHRSLGQMRLVMDVVRTIGTLGRIAMRVAMCVERQRHQQRHIGCQKDKGCYVTYRFH